MSRPFPIVPDDPALFKMLFVPVRVDGYAVYNEHIKGLEERVRALQIRLEECGDETARKLEEAAKQCDAARAKETMCTEEVNVRKRRRLEKGNAEEDEVGDDTAEEEMIKARREAEEADKNKKMIEAEKEVKEKALREKMAKEAEEQKQLKKLKSIMDRIQNLPGDGEPEHETIMLLIDDLENILKENKGRLASKKVFSLALRTKDKLIEEQRKSLVWFRDVFEEDQMQTETRERTKGRFTSVYTNSEDEAAVLDANRKLRDDVLEAMIKMDKFTRLLGRINESQYTVDNVASAKDVTVDKVATWRGLKLHLDPKERVVEVLDVAVSSSGLLNNTFLNETSKSLMDVNRYPVRKDKGVSRQFEYVFLHETQREVYERVRPFLWSALGGKNIGLFMYGGTASGKTYTSIGKPGENAGIIRRMVDELARVSSGTSVQCQCYEIYGRNSMSSGPKYNIYDILSNMETFTDKKKPTTRSSFFRYTSTNGTVKEMIANDDWYDLDKAEAKNKNAQAMTREEWHPFTKSVVRDDGGNLQVEMSDGKTFKTLVEFVSHAMKYRRTVSTTQNPDGSSRGHFIFRLMLTREEGGARKTNSIYVGDFAGIESAKGEGVDVQEGQAINQSLENFIRHYRNKEANRCFDDQNELYGEAVRARCGLDDPIAWILKDDLLTDTSSKIMLIACLYPAVAVRGTVAKKAKTLELWPMLSTKMAINHTVLQKLFPKKK